MGNPAALSGRVPQTAAQNGQMTQAGIEANVAALAKRLEQKPEDPDGWAMLGRSYINLEKYKEASDAYARATSLKPQDPDLLTEYAFAVAMANGRQLQGKPTELLRRRSRLRRKIPKRWSSRAALSFRQRITIRRLFIGKSYWPRRAAIQN